MSDHWFRHFSKSGISNYIRVGDGRGRWRTACGSINEIKLPKFARDKIIILHEIAHSATLRTHPDAAWHGPEFCFNFLMLVGRWLGKEMKEELWDCMRAHRVKVMGSEKKTRRKKQLSSAQLAALARGRERLRQKREAADKVHEFQENNV